MRLLAGTAILIGGILIFATFMFFHTGELSGNLLESLRLIEEKIKQDEWEGASQEVESLKALWNKADARWTPFMDHREIELLATAVVKVARWVDFRNKEHALVEIGVTERMIRGVQEEGKPNIKNIF